MSNKLPKAILLLGLTGSGKSPLGQYLVKNRIGGARCFHLDFGAELRDISESESLPPGLNEQDLKAIRSFLSSNQLLTDQTFYIAEAVVSAFFGKHGIRAGDIVVLDGLPRKIEQAKGLKSLLDVRTVIYLNCSLDIARQRIAENSGGDRTGRIDDQLEDIRRKFEIFHRETLPLLTYYGAGRANMHEFEVAVNTSPEDIINKIGRNLPADLGVGRNHSL